MTHDTGDVRQVIEALRRLAPNNVAERNRAILRAVELLETLTPQPSKVEPSSIAEALRPFAEIGALMFARPQVPDSEVVVELRGINGQRGGLTRGHFKAAHEARQRLTAQPAPSGWQQRIAMIDHPWHWVGAYSDEERCFFCDVSRETAEHAHGGHRDDCLWQNAKAQESR